jgi:CRISPR-associated endoribonuclease Cas6
MLFVAMIIQLELENGRLSSRGLYGVYAHAAILHAISDHDEKAGHSLHTAHRYKPMTVAIVTSNTCTALLRVTFMTQEGLDYAHLLVNALSTRPTLRLGDVNCTVKSVSLDDPHWCGVNTWNDLGSGPVGDHISLRFVTPTAIMKRDGDGGRYTSLFPVPEDIFPGLERRWRALNGPELPDDLDRYICKGGCVASSHKLDTDVFSTPRRTQKGFTGWVLYECRKPDKVYVAAINALARMAFFTGVGYQTARGMGAVKPEITE